MMHPDQRVMAWFEVLGIPLDYAEARSLTPIAEVTELVSLGLDIFQRPQSAHPAACHAWQDMATNAQKENITLDLVSAFRSIDYQAMLIEKKLAQGQMIEDILKVSAAPGYSEHHSGMALDLNTTGIAPLTQSFADTKAYAWLKAHAGEFGFCESFGPDNPHGLIWEPWHWCYQPFLIKA